MTKQICIWKRISLVTRLVTKSLNSPRRPRNAYKLKSASEIGRLAAASSSNKALAFCRNWITDSSPCRRSWREPWSYIIRELDVEARACSSVCQTEHEVGQSITRWRTSMDSERSRALRMSWSCCFQWRKCWDTWRSRDTIGGKNMWRGAGDWTINKTENSLA